MTPDAANALYLEMTGWKRTESQQYNLLRVRWEKGGLTCTQAQAVRLQQETDRERQTVERRKIGRRK